MGKDKTIAAFFAGIGGIEEGFQEKMQKQFFSVKKMNVQKQYLQSIIQVFLLQTIFQL